MKTISYIFFKKGEVLKNVPIMGISHQGTPFTKIENKVIFILGCPNYKIGERINIIIKNDGKRFSFGEKIK